MTALWKTVRSTVDRYLGVESPADFPGSVGRGMVATCNVCGKSGTFLLPPGSTPRESYRCPHCKTTSRYRSVARGLLRAIRDLRGIEADSLATLVTAPAAEPLRVYDTQRAFSYDETAYPHPDLLSAVEWIDVETSLWDPATPRGAALGERVTNQNLESLTFPDGSFDIVVTSDVMEHVRLPDLAHAEIRRVLKPGGVYLFTVPAIRWQYDDIVRVRVTEPSDPARDEHVMQPEYHGDTNGPENRALFYRVFGTGLDRHLEDLGYSVSFLGGDVPENAIVDAELYYCRLQDAEAARVPATASTTLAPPPSAAPPPEAAQAFSAGHYYSPIVDVAEAERDRGRIWPRTPRILGIDFREAHHRELLEGPFKVALEEYDYPGSRPQDAGELAYFEGNGFFEWLDSKILFAVLRHIGPSRMIEVGSGYSSLLAGDVNRRFLGNRVEITCLDPEPQPFLLGGVPGISRVFRARVQDVPTSVFEVLRAGDILFVDSSHVAKTGSDVNHIFFEILPRLAPGVLVHIHDIFLPHDYPTDWVVREKRSWNEQYLVRAFLMDSAAFEVYFACNWAYETMPDLVRLATRRAPTGGSSIWIRKLPKPAPGAAG